MSQHLYQISQSTNSPTMKGILVQSKFILFRVVNSISFWNGFEDGDANSEHSINEHPEDLYDAWS